MTSDKKKVLITGGDGYVARSLCEKLKTSYDITTISRSDFDLRDRDCTDSFFRGRYFDAVIHTAIKGGSRLQLDSPDTTHDNLSMFYNLLNNKHCFGKLLNIGSGAEVGLPTSPYGLSKSIISKLVDQETYFYNIRVYAVFDENELGTRFIKANLLRYLNKQPMLIEQDKYMDFYYMEDLALVVDYYLRKNPRFELCPKLFNCSYKQHLTLTQIASIINNLQDHKVDIIILNQEIGQPYVGTYTMPEIENTEIPFINTIGLEQGIKLVHQKLQNL